MSNSEISVGQNDRALNEALNRLARQAQSQQLKEMLTQWASLITLFGRIPSGLRRAGITARLPFSALAPETGDNMPLHAAAHPLRAPQDHPVPQDHLRTMQETPHTAPEHLHIPAQHLSAALESLPAPRESLLTAAQQWPVPRSTLCASAGSLPAAATSLGAPLNNLRAAADSPVPAVAQLPVPVTQCRNHAGAFQPLACADHNVNAGTRTDILTSLHSAAPRPKTARDTVAASLRLHARDAGLISHAAHHALHTVSVMAATAFAAPMQDGPALRGNPPLKTAALPGAATGRSALPATSPATQAITHKAAAVPTVFPLVPTLATAPRAFPAPLPVLHARQTVNIDAIEKRAVPTKNSLTAEPSSGMESGISERNRMGGLPALTGTLNVSALHSVTQSNALQLNSVVQPRQTIIQNPLVTVMAPKNPLMTADINKLLPAYRPTPEPPAPGISERFKVTPLSPSALFAATTLLANPLATTLHGHTPDAVRPGGETARFSPQENAAGPTGASRVHFTPLTAGGKVTHDNRTFTQNIQITVPEGQPLTAQDLQKQFNELMAQQANQAFFNEIQRY